MRQRTRNICAAAIVIAALTGAAFGLCRNHRDDLTASFKKVERSIAQAMPEVPSSYTFDYKLLQEMALENKGKSFVFSPYSVKDCITLAYNGMNGGAKKELKNLGIDSAAVKANAAFDKKCAGKEGISIANRLYYNNGFDGILNTDLIRKDSSEHIDVSDPYGSADKINKWISKKTRGKINDLIDSSAIDDRTAAVLCNAIWMKMKWENEDDYSESDVTWYKVKSGEQDVYDGFSGNIELSDAKIIKDAKTARFKYASPDGLDLYMYIILPDKKTEGAADEWLTENHSLDSILDFKDNKSLKDYASADFEIPDFETSMKTSMITPLSKIGLDKKFTDTDDIKYKTYRKLLKKKPAGLKGIYISDIKHGAYVKTNIEGTEAAAATYEEYSDAVTAAIGEPEKEFHLYCDHPFIFIIKEENSGQILFMGKITDDAMEKNRDVGSIPAMINTENYEFPDTLK